MKSKDRTGCGASGSKFLGLGKAQDPPLDQVVRLLNRSQESSFNSVYRTHTAPACAVAFSESVFPAPQERSRPGKHLQGLLI